MTQRFTPTHTPLSAALLTSLLTLVATPAAALDETPDPVDLDRVQVTGSRIARAGFVTPSPVTAITAEEIRTSGANSIGDLMTRLLNRSPLELGTELPTL